MAKRLFEEDPYDPTGLNPPDVSLGVGQDYFPPTPGLPKVTDPAPPPPPPPDPGLVKPTPQQITRPPVIPPPAPPAPAPTPAPTQPPPPNYQDKVPTPAPKSVTDFDWSNYKDPKSAIEGALNSGIGWDPEALVDSVNNLYGLKAPHSIAWRAIKDAPGGGVYGMPSGGYYALGTDGKWGWNPGDSGGDQGGGPAPSPMPTPPPSSPFDNTYPTSVGDDPFSKLMQGALSALIMNGGRLTSREGQSGLDALNNYLTHNGNMTGMLAGIRDKMAILEKGQLADARGQLADRGLLSEGSEAQGPELSTIGRLQSSLASQYGAQAESAIGQNDASLLEAIKTATGLDQQSTLNVLAAINSGTNRQQVLGDLAIRTLDQNRLWNQFLAQYGLDRDKFEYDVQHGQMGDVNAAVAAFIKYLDTINQGHV